MATVDARDFEQLGEIMWDFAHPFIEEEVAFRLYEARNKYLDIKAMKPSELDFLRALAERFGDGYFDGGKL